MLEVALGEQCDDGNHVPGDGCSAFCQLEKQYVQEMEPNDTNATANPLGQAQGFLAVNEPAADLDWFSFEVTVAGSSVRVVVNDGLGGCPAGFDPFAKFYSPAMNELARNHDAGGALGYCSALQPLVDVGVNNLPVGTYFLSVENAFPTAVPLYVVDITVLPPACGDGVLQPSETCDDGGVVPGDGCSATCQLEGSYSQETEPNDTQALANPLPAGSAGFLGAINPAGDQDCYSINVTVPGSSVFLETGNGLGGCLNGFFSSIKLFSPAHLQLAFNDFGAHPYCSTLDPYLDSALTNLPVGTYTACVLPFNSLVAPFYVLDVRVTPPGCGDLVVQASEQCDDGNTVGGDGCSATCQSEPGREIEPNNTLATATPLWPTTSSWVGSITPLADHDYYAFTLLAPGHVTLTTHDVGDAAACATSDTLIHLLDSAGTQIAQDDDLGVNACSRLAPTALLAAGTYYVWVQQAFDEQAIRSYQLDLQVQ
jgi:cysteine-rich repeat protein